MSAKKKKRPVQPSTLTPKEYAASVAEKMFSFEPTGSEGIVGVGMRYAPSVGGGVFCGKHGIEFAQQMRDTVAAAILEAMGEGEGRTLDRGWKFSLEHFSSEALLQELGRRLEKKGR